MFHCVGKDIVISVSLAIFSAIAAAAAAEDAVVPVCKNPLRSPIGPKMSSNIMH